MVTSTDRDEIAFVYVCMFMPAKNMYFRPTIDGVQSRKDARQFRNVRFGMDGESRNDICIGGILYI